MLKNSKLNAKQQMKSCSLVCLFKNNEDGLQALSYNIIKFTSEPTPKHFAETLEAVVGDSSLDPCQTDPLEIIEAWKKYEVKVQSVIFTKKAILSTNKLLLLKRCCRQNIYKVHAGLGMFVFCYIPNGY